MSRFNFLKRAFAVAVSVAIAIAATPMFAQQSPYGVAPYGAYQQNPYQQSASPYGYGAQYQAPAARPQYGQYNQAYNQYNTRRQAPVYNPYQQARVAAMPTTAIQPEPVEAGVATSGQAFGQPAMGGSAAGNCAGCGGASGCDYATCGDGGYGGLRSMFGMGGDGCCRLGLGGHLHGGCGACGDAGCFGGCGGCSQWFGGVYGLYMTRDVDNEVWLSWDGADLASAILGTHDAGFNWQPGTEIRFGRTIGSCGLAWEVVFWGLYEDTEWTEVFASDLVGSLNTSLDFSGLEYDNGSGAAPVNDFYDDAQNHRVASHFEVQNIEINFIKFPLCGSIGPCGACCGGGGFGGAGIGGLYGAASPCCGPRFTLVGTAGVRYMRTNEWLDFDTDDTDTIWGNSADELYYDIELDNNLIGFQLGAAANYQATQCLSLYCDSKFGLYGNHIKHRSLIYGTGGFAQVQAGLPYAGENFDIRSSKDDVAMIGELRLGAAYNVGRNCNGRANWRLYGGYRAIGISGIALPVNQIPRNFGDTQGIAYVNSNGSMILHGLEAGVEFTY